MADISVIQTALERGYSHDEIADILAKDAGYDPSEIRGNGYSSVEILGKLGYEMPAPPEAGGLIASAKQAVGATIKGAGQAAADFIPGVDSDNALKRYGQEVVDANPTAVHGLGDIVERPWTATKEAVGNAAGSMGGMLGVRAVGQGITAAAPLAGPAAPVVAAIGQAVSWLGPAAIAALPSFGGIRDKQILDDPANEADAKSKAIAAMGAAAVGAIEVAFGPQQWALAAMTKEGRAQTAKMFASTTLGKDVAKGILKGGAIEGSEELAQNPIEQMAGYSDPRTPENVKETLFGGAMGAIGGGVLGGAGGGLLHRSPQTPASSPEVAPQGPETPTGLLGYQPGPPLVVFPDGSTMTGAEAEQRRLDGMIQPVRATPADILAAPNIDTAIAAAADSVAASEDEFTVLLKSEQSDLAYLRRDAAAESIKAADFARAKEQQTDIQIDQANALTRVSGFDDQTPTAMQLALQRAKQRVSPQPPAQTPINSTDLPSVGAQPEPVAAAPNVAAQPAPELPVGRLDETAVAAAPSLGFVEAFGSLKNGGATEDLLSRAFDALKAGKATISGIKDPILSRAKPAFDAGLIQSAADLKRFEQDGYPTTNPLDSYLKQNAEGVWKLSQPAPVALRDAVIAEMDRRNQEGTANAATPAKTIESNPALPNLPQAAPEAGALPGGLSATVPTDAAGKVAPGFDAEGGNIGRSLRESVDRSFSSAVDNEISIGRLDAETGDLAKRLFSSGAGMKEIRRQVADRGYAVNDDGSFAKKSPSTGESPADQPGGTTNLSAISGEISTPAAPERSITQNKEGAIYVKGYTQEQMGAARDALGIKNAVITSKTSVFPTGTNLAALKEALNPGGAYLPTKDEVARMADTFPEFIEGNKFNVRKAYNHVQKHGTQRFHDKADAQAYAEKLANGEGGNWTAKRVNAKNGVMGYWHAEREGRVFSPVEQVVLQAAEAKQAKNEAALDGDEEAAYFELLDKAYAALGDERVGNDLERLGAQYKGATGAEYRKAAQTYFEEMIREQVEQTTERPAGVSEETRGEPAGAGRNEATGGQQESEDEQGVVEPTEPQPASQVAEPKTIADASLGDLLRAAADKADGKAATEGGKPAATKEPAQGAEKVSAGETANKPGTFNSIEAPRKTKPQDETLIIQHNLSAANLLHAVRMGGIPVPSLAITEKDAPLDGFGEITLLGSSAMADPKGYAGTKAFGADIYSPRYPTVKYITTPNMRKRAEGMLKDGLEATNSSVAWDEVVDRGSQELASTPAVRWQFLKERGIEPTIVRVAVKPLSPALQPFANDTRHTVELDDDPAFIAAAYAAHEADLVKAYGGDAEAKTYAADEIAKLKQNAASKGVSHLVRESARQVNQHRMDSAAAGAIDKSDTNRMMESQIYDAGLRDEMDQYAADLLQSINPDEKIFQGYTNSGNRKYTPHTLENVVKILKKELRDGEGFNYGVGSIRSAFTPQFRSIKQIREAKGRLMNKAGFESVKKEIDDEFSAMSDKLVPYHSHANEFGFGDIVSAMMYDSAKMGVPRSLKENMFIDVPAEVQQDVAAFLSKLRTLPTAYFEAKILRDVDLAEFSGAVVPEGVDPKVLEALRARGITDIRTYKKGDDGARAKAVTSLAEELHAAGKGTLFSLEADQRSAVSHAIDRALAQESEQPTDTKRGAGWLKIKLRQAQHKGELSAKAVEMVEWLVKQNPALVKYLAVAVENPKGLADGFNAVSPAPTFKAVDTESTEFKAWFGDSKVVDSDGKPLRVYHGTPRDFSKFKLSKNGIFGRGIYLTTDTNDAEGFSYGGDENGDNIMPLYAAINRPYKIDFRDTWPDLYRDLIGDEPANTDKEYPSREQEKRIHAALVAAGHDGIEVYGAGDMATSTFYIALDPTQVKSATSNTGAFDPTNPDIRQSIDRPTGAAGNYNHFTQVMALFRGNASDTTAVHEILHHLERMMPAEMQAEIRTEWRRAATKEMLAAMKAKDQKRIDYFTAVLAGDQKKATELLTGKGMDGFNAVEPAPTFKAVEVEFDGGDGLSFDGGVLTLHVSKAMRQYRADIKTIILPRALDKFFSPLDEDEFVRSSTSIDDAKRVSSKTHRGSRNHSDGDAENFYDKNSKTWRAGLSVSKAAEFPAKSMYIIRGDEVGVGTDQEPLIDPKTAEVVMEFKSSADFYSWWNKQQEERLKELGFTNEQYRNLRANLPIKFKDLAIGQDYQYLNPSEFWAVRMTNTAQARFEAKSIWARSLQWLREALEHIKGALGLKSDHPLLKALDDLIARGNGEFVSKEMLGSSEVYAAPRIIGDSGRQYTPDQEAMFKQTGREVDGVTILGKLREWASVNWRQGLFDQFQPVRAISAKGYTLLRLSKGATGAFEAFMQHGKLSLKDGAYDADTTGGVMQEVFFPLGKETTDFLYWIAGNRAERLAMEGKERLFSVHDIAAAKSLASGTTDFDYVLANGQSTRDRTLIYRDSLTKFNAFNKNVMDMAEQSGLIDAASRHLWEHEFYVPFYRLIDDTDGGVRGMNIKQGVVRQQAFKKLKGGKEGLNDLLANTLMNWAHLIDASAKNRGAKETLEAAARLGAAQPAQAGDKNTVWYMDGGKKAEYTIDDPELLVALNALDYSGLRGPIMDALQKPKHWLTIGVTASPFFKVRNLIRDSVQAVATSGLSYNIAGNVVNGINLTNRDRQEYVSALAGGGLIRFGTMLEGNEAARTRQLIKKGAKDEHILNNEGKIRAFYDKYLEPGISAYNEIGNRGEEINRMSLYDQMIKSGADHATASLMARDLMDFSMQGSWTSIRFLAQTVPFMNARLEGMYKLGRAAKGDPAKFGAVLGAVAMFSLALLAAYSDDDDWKKREDWDRDNYWWFKVGGVAFRIPKPFEIGAIATLAERSAELMFDKGMTGKRFRQVTTKLLADQLSMNPTPQLVKPILDIYANKDSFSGRPIETMGMERLDKERRFTSSTSMPARGLSTATGGALSPVQIDHLVRGYFAWLGAFAVGTADLAVRMASDGPERPSRDYWKFATGGMIAETDSASSRYVSQMYDQAKEIETAYGTWRDMSKQASQIQGQSKQDALKDAQEYRKENADKIAKHSQVGAAKRQISVLNERIRIIERSDKTAGEKRALINNIQKLKDQAARRVVATRRD